MADLAERGVQFRVCDDTLDAQKIAKETLLEFGHFLRLTASRFSLSVALMATLDHRDGALDELQTNDAVHGW